MSFAVSQSPSTLESEASSALTIVETFCRDKTPSRFTTIIQGQQAVAICFRNVCDCFSADSRIWNGTKVRGYLVHALGTIKAHVSRVANWRIIGLHTGEKGDTIGYQSGLTPDEVGRRADKAKRIFESACKHYLQTFPTDDITSWEEIISKKGILSPREEDTLRPYGFLGGTYKVALWRLGIKLAQNVKRKYWTKFVVYGPGGTWNLDYRLPNKDQQITMEQGLQIVYRACKALTEHWSELSSYPLWQSLTPEQCCTDPARVNRAFLFLSTEKNLSRSVDSHALLPPPAIQEPDIPPQARKAYQQFTESGNPAGLEASLQASPCQQEPEMPPPASLE